jgi:nucleoside-diphosphate-sugar epimerase
MAKAFGAPAPRRIPRWLVRLLAPNLAAFAFDTNLRVSNAKAKDELGWQPRFSTYREGIAAIAAEAPSTAADQQTWVAANQR